MKTLLEWINQKQKPEIDTKTIEFCEKRLEGAIKIASQARAKGGTAMLTAYHFEAKLPIYREIIRKLTKGEKLDLKKKYRETLSRLGSTLSQKNFQIAAGALEVYGEVSIEEK